MYGPVESCAPPTLTGNNDLDRQRFDGGDATRILELLAYRGDDDWRIRYQEGQIELEDFRQARDNPGSKILERKLKKPPSVLAKVRARAINDDELHARGKRPTMSESQLGDLLPPILPRYNKGNALRPPKANNHRGRGRAPKHP